MVDLRYAPACKETGWLLREQSIGRGLLRKKETTPRRLYFKLRGSSLSAHPHETYPEHWRSPLLEIVSSEPEHRRLVLKLEHAVVTVVADPGPDFERWRAALSAAAGSSFEKYYKRERYLARGHFSSVYMASDRITGEKFAVKIIKKDKNDLEKAKKFVRREVKVLSVTRHPHLVRAVDFFSSNGKPHIVLEFVSGGSLRDLIRDKKFLSQEEARPIMRGLLSGLAYLHKANIVHRDLKPENILMEKDNFPKITDFGLATFRNEASSCHTVVGTPSYVSPEVMRNMPYGPPADVWATGIILYFMITGERPYLGADRNEIKKAVLEGHFNFPADVLGPDETQLRHLISSLLAHDQRSRISAADALNHPWLVAPPVPYHYRR